MNVTARAIELLLVVGLLSFATNGIAQSKGGSAFRPNPNLTDQEKRGEHLFLQRCSVCHMAHYTKSDPAGHPPNFGGLEGLFKGAGPAEEKVLRDHILKGSPNMPGFQYSLQPEEVDVLIAYLKTV